MCFQRVNFHVKTPNYGLNIYIYITFDMKVKKKITLGHFHLLLLYTMLIM